MPSDTLGPRGRRAADRRCEELEEALRAMLESHGKFRGKQTHKIYQCKCFGCSKANRVLARPVAGEEVEGG